MTPGKAVCRVQMKAVRANNMINDANKDRPKRARVDVYLQQVSRASHGPSGGPIGGHVVQWHLSFVWLVHPSAQSGRLPSHRPRTSEMLP